MHQLMFDDRECGLCPVQQRVSGTLESSHVSAWSDLPVGFVRKCRTTERGMSAPATAFGCGPSPP